VGEKTLCLSKRLYDEKQVTARGEPLKKPSQHQSGVWAKERLYRRRSGKSVDRFAKKKSRDAVQQGRGKNVGNCMKEK